MNSFSSYGRTPNDSWIIGSNISFLFVCHLLLTQMLNRLPKSVDLRTCLTGDVIDESVPMFAGVLRGSGSQDLGAYSNLGAYYAVGVPLGVLLGFHYHLNGIVRIIRGL